MKSFNFADVVKTYEKKRASINYKENKNTECEIETIKKDINGTNLIIFEKHENNVFHKILYEVLTRIPVKYAQGMSEAVAIFVFYYFEKELDIVEDDAYIIDKKLLKQVIVTVTNILTDKYMPLIDDDFKLYLHYDEVFRKMMKKRNYDLVQEENITHMNTTLTWYLRSVESYEILKALVGYIIACPTTMPFLILIKYFDTINSKALIETIDEDFFEQLIKLEKEFIDTEVTMNLKKKPIKAKMILCGAIAFGLTAMILYKIFKKNE